MTETLRLLLVLTHYRILERLWQRNTKRFLNVSLFAFIKTKTGKNIINMVLIILNLCVTNAFVLYCNKFALCCVSVSDSQSRPVGHCAPTKFFDH
jgi:hypothetical protein